MAIKEITSKALGKAKSGWRWDKKRELFVTFQVDTQFNGNKFLKRYIQRPELYSDTAILCQVFNCF